MTDLSYYYTLPAVIDGVKAGKSFQWQDDRGCWHDSFNDAASLESLKNFLENNYRVRLKPAKPEVRWWSKPEDMPFPCWIRPKTQDSVAFLVVAKWNNRFAYHDSCGTHTVSWKNIAAYEHSTDLKTWHPCCQAEGEQA